MADIFYYVTQIVWFYHCPNRLRNLKVNTEIEIIENIFRQNINNFLISWTVLATSADNLLLPLLTFTKAGKFKRCLTRASVKEQREASTEPREVKMIARSTSDSFGVPPLLLNTLGYCQKKSFINNCMMQRLSLHNTNTFF